MLGTLLEMHHQKCKVPHLSCVCKKNPYGTPVYERINVNYMLVKVIVILLKENEKKKKSQNYN